MSHRDLSACVRDLERHGRLRRVEAAIDPRLELAEVQRRLYRAGGPAVLFTNVAGTRFPMLANLFGTVERCRWIFRHTLGRVRKLVELKADPGALARKPWRYLDVPLAALSTLPMRVASGPILRSQTTVGELPQLVCWPGDGGAFVTLPLVYTEDPDRPGWRRSNLGMYRVQLSGNDYAPNEEVGLHYQIHRGIGVHHAAAIRRGEPLRVNVVVGGPPSLAVAAVMPLPEGLPELLFAGALGGRRIRLVTPPGGGPAIPAEADFCISGTIDPAATKPEGPFGDHLGYYAKVHPFPVMKVDKVWHRPGAIWPFTVVGRPPQEDSSFGEFIHDLTGPVIPTVLPGVKAVHAVDAAGVHPLLLAIGSERYVPYAAERRPQELLTIANAVLGQGQLSLAKFLLLVAHEDAPDLDIHDIPAFFAHLLERFDPRRDLHFQTRVTMDTLDYTGGAFNEGSKLAWVAAGPKRRELGRALGSDLKLPAEFRNVRLAMPGVLAVECGADLRGVARDFPVKAEGFPLICVVESALFAAASLNNFVWNVFTRADPARDVSGFGETVEDKHWGCTGPVVIDARPKPFHAAPLVEDPAVTRRVDALAARGGPLHGLI